MSEFLDLIDKARIALISSEFLEKTAEAEFKKMDELLAQEWSPTKDKEIEIVRNSIKALVAKSEIEYKNLEYIEKQINDRIKKIK